ncbi:hypothetical protein GCM10009785_12300 [Brooklawnia cerclae]|uniref:Uncharacterized protein n=1 Tax=Brooklawnia cerclae TaxID=349934 RepID=A0ABX0SKS2_9ACTN|nr:hypothetical protein [Brooklawnia cerclae]NIH58544.1 hypothetical protein [Brooklawnia cerclae]
MLLEALPDEEPDEGRVNGDDAPDEAGVDDPLVGGVPNGEV